VAAVAAYAAWTAERDRVVRREVRPLIVPGRLWRATVVVGDLLGAVGIVLCIPFVILAVGIPIVLCVRLLMWIGGLL
jgi:hypothetical protein